MLFRNMAFWDYSESQTLYGGIDMSTGSLLVISGFSGAGKGTVIKKLLEEYDDYALSISATTRHPREVKLMVLAISLWIEKSLRL